MAAAIVVATLVAPQAALAMTPEAEAILNRVKATTAINSICNDRGKVRDAVTAATRALLNEKVLSGMPRSDAQAAGQHIMQNCGSL